MEKISQPQPSELDPIVQKQWEQSQLLPTTKAHRRLSALDLMMLGFILTTPLPLLSVISYKNIAEAPLWLIIAIYVCGVSIIGLLILWSNKVTAQDGLSTCFSIKTSHGVPLSKIITIIRLCMGICFTGIINFQIAQILNAATITWIPSLHELSIPITSTRALSVGSFGFYIIISLLPLLYSKRGFLKTWRLYMWFIPLIFVGNVLWIAWLMFLGPDLSLLSSWLSNKPHFTELALSDLFSSGISMMVLVSAPFLFSSGDYIRYAKNPHKSSSPMLLGLCIGILLFLFSITVTIAAHYHIRGNISFDPIWWFTAYNHPITILFMLAWLVGGLYFYNHVININPASNALSALIPPKISYEKSIRWVYACAFIIGPALWFLNNKFWKIAILCAAVILLLSFIINLLFFSIWRKHYFVLDELFREKSKFPKTIVLSSYITFGVTITGLVSLLLISQNTAYTYFILIPFLAIMAFIIASYLFYRTANVVKRKLPRHAKDITSTNLVTRKKEYDQEQSSSHPGQLSSPQPSIEDEGKSDEKKKDKKIKLEEESDAVKSWLE